MSVPNACDQADTVCLSLTGQTPAAAVDYVAVSATALPFALKFIGFALVAAAVFVIVVWLVDSARAKWIAK